MGSICLLWNVYVGRELWTGVVLHDVSNGMDVSLPASTSYEQSTTRRLSYYYYQAYYAL